MGTVKCIPMLMDVKANQSSLCIASFVLIVQDAGTLHLVSTLLKIPFVVKLFHVVPCVKQDVWRIQNIQIVKNFVQKSLVFHGAIEFAVKLKMIHIAVIYCQRVHFAKQNVMAILLFQCVEMLVTRIP